MAQRTQKEILERYLRAGREALLWKLEGLSPYDARRPMTPTGTNLVGLVKHTASVEAGYLGAVFGRPFPDEPFPWFSDNAEPNADMWATTNESVAGIVELYQRVALHSGAAIDALDLDAGGHVPWWGDHGDVTLLQILVHVATETHRQSGHADILRKLIDGSVGLRSGNENLPDVDADWWFDYRNGLEDAARHATD
jgi:uncharacterized damage-inducible protein DinB